MLFRSRAGGVQVLEYTGRMVHAKTMVVDAELAVIGTANLDNRSFRLNFEVIAAIYDREATACLARLFEDELGLSFIAWRQRDQDQAQPIAVLPNHREGPG